MLSPEEKAELLALEKEEKERLGSLEALAERQHLEALRLVKKLKAKHGVPGLDFVVLETRLGVIALKRPVDVEIDQVAEDQDRATLEKFVTGLVLEPTQAEVTKLMAEHHGLVGALVKAAFEMLKVVREEESKK